MIKVNDVVYNKHYNTIGIVRDMFDYQDLRTDADGVVYAEDCIKINTMDMLDAYIINKNVNIAPSTLEEIKKNNLLK